MNLETSDQTKDQEIVARRRRSTWRNRIDPLRILTIGIAVLGILGGLLAPFAGYHWMTGPGIAVLVLFMPLTASSFLKNRLPEKEKEYRRIMEVLGQEGISATYTDVVLGTEYRSADYALPIAFLCAFSFFGFYMLFAGNAAVLLQGMQLSVDGIGEHGTRGIVAMSMAFLGAYVWSIQYLFRRLITVDLPPGAYYSVGTRLVLSAFLALIYYKLSSVTEMEMAVALTPVVAFLTGVFPQRLLQWLLDRVGGAVNLFTKPKRAAEELPLEMLEGMSIFHKARLGELGIDNLQNLVNASLVEILIKTPFPPRQVIDWMAQGRLILMVKDNFTALRKSGVRTIFSFLQVTAEDKGLSDLAAQSGLSPELLRTVQRSCQDRDTINRLEAAYRLLQPV